MPPWGCDRELRGSAPNAVKRFKRKEPGRNLGLLWWTPSCNSLEGGNCSPSWTWTQFSHYRRATCNRLSKLQIFI